MSVLKKPEKDSALLIEYEYGGQTLSANNFALKAPLEFWDPSLFTEVDPNGDFVALQAHQKLTVTSLKANVVAYRYYDFTAGFFAADKSFQFRFKFDPTVTPESDSWLTCAMLANLLGNVTTIDAAAGDFVAVSFFNEAAGADFRIEECNGGVLATTEVAVTNDTTYWVDFQIIQDGSGGGFGVLELRVYSDAFVTQVGATGTLNLTQNVAFRYGFYGASSSGGGTEKLSAELTEMTFGESVSQSDISVSTSYDRFTNWSFDLVHPTDATDFLAVPSIEVRFPKFSGVLVEKPIIILHSLESLVEDFTFASLVSSGEPVAPVTVRVWEYLQTVDGVSGDVLLLFQGTINRVTRNADGNSGKIRIEVLGIKSRLDVSLGLTCQHQCPWTVGVGLCVGANRFQPDLDFLTEVATVDSISDHTMVLSELQTHSSRWWDRGYIERDGLRILIREWVSGTSFLLAKAPPASWDGENVAVTPGCDKTAEICAERYGNQERFGGIGFALPTYNPSFEEPG